MKYRIKITKIVDNPNYNEETFKEYEKNQRSPYNYERTPSDNATMVEFYEVTALESELDEETFKAIRKGIIETL